MHISSSYIQHHYNVKYWKNIYYIWYMYIPGTPASGAAPEHHLRCPLWAASVTCDSRMRLMSRAVVTPNIHTHIIETVHIHIPLQNYLILNTFNSSHKWIYTKHSKRMTSLNFVPHKFTVWDYCRGSVWVVSHYYYIPVPMLCDTVAATNRNAETQFCTYTIATVFTCKNMQLFQNYTFLNLECV
jgi:hypothetical protein